jgi:hypothetical protein
MFIERKSKMARKEGTMTDYPTFIIKFGGHKCSLTPCIRQPYRDCCFEAGLVEGHPIENVYFRLSRENEESTTILMRSDEMGALSWCMTGTIWSYLMGCLDRKNDIKKG